MDLDPRPSTLDPRPSTLDPRPSTLHAFPLPLARPMLYPKSRMTDGHQPDSSSPASASASASFSPALPAINTPLSTNFWSALESVPGGTAPYIIWKHHLKSDGQSGSDLETFTSLFLKARPGKPLDFVPCPWNCGCHHKVVPRDNGTLAGICQCAC